MTISFQKGGVKANKTGLCVMLKTLVPLCSLAVPPQLKVHLISRALAANRDAKTAPPPVEGPVVLVVLSQAQAE